MNFCKAVGCLYGQLIGDALGCRYEFMTAPVVQKMIKDDLNNMQLLPILGGGPFHMVAGQVLFLV